MKKDLFRFFHFLVVVVAISLIAGCQTIDRSARSGSSYIGEDSADALIAPAASRSHSRNPLTAGQRSVFPPELRERPGLGTEWGEDRESHIDYTRFSRGSRSRPWATGKVFYNDAAGARAMANSSGFSWQSSGLTRVGPVSIGLKSASGRSLKCYSTVGNRYYVGEHGDRYKIYIKNHIANRIEVVVSVDGLDVNDGKRASQSKRGYIIKGNGSLTIDGFRQSEASVAAFRFGSVSESYAQQKHGDSRNVGVVGVAVYTEYGRDPSHRYSRDTSTRKGANPFPASGRFATPPR